MVNMTVIFEKAICKVKRHQWNNFAKRHCHLSNNIVDPSPKTCFRTIKGHHLQYNIQKQWQVSK